MVLSKPTFILASSLVALASLAALPHPPMFPKYANWHPLALISNCDHFQMVRAHSSQDHSIYTSTNHTNPHILGHTTHHPPPPTPYNPTPSHPCLPLQPCHSASPQKILLPRPRLRGKAAPRLRWFRCLRRRRMQLVEGEAEANYRAFPSSSVKRTPKLRDPSAFSWNPSAHTGTQHCSNWCRNQWGPNSAKGAFCLIFAQLNPVQYC